jgi:uncharacterized delta-60 repeat protein
MKTAITLTAVFLLTVLSFFSQSVNAQVIESWESQYNDSVDGFDFSTSIALDHSGNSVVTGFSESMGVFDMVTVKYSPTGAMLWSKKYDGPGHGYDKGIQVTLDDTGNVFVVGMSEGAGTMMDFVTIKYSPTGELKWVARFDGPLHMADEPSCITLDAAGNVYIGGTGAVLPGESFDFITVKYSPTGGLAWVKTFDRPIPGGAEHITDIEAHGGAVYVTGFSIAPGFVDMIITIGYTPGGGPLFASFYTGPGFGGRKPNSMAVSPITGDIYVCGYDYTGSSAAGIDYVLIKYSGGSIAWVKKFNGTGSDYDEAKKIVIDDSDHIYVTGYSEGVSTANDYLTIKYTSSGDTVWSKRYNNSEDGDDRAEDIKVDGDGNVYVTGWSRDHGTKYDFLTLKYSSTGAKLWDIRRETMSSTIDAKAYGLQVDGAGSVYVVGEAEGTVSGNNDITIIKYEEVMTGVTGNTNSTPEGFELKQNYPNPFNPSTKISFSIPTAGMTTLKIYDMAGKEVAQLVNGNMNAGSHEFNFDSKGLSSGVYFYTLQSGDFVETKKMNLIK